MSVEEEDRLYINTWKAEGREEGKKEEKKEIVKSMLEKKYDLEEISNITGLSLDEIKNIKKVYKI